MNKAGLWVTLSGGLVLAIFLAGFFHAESRSPGAAAQLNGAEAPAPMPVWRGSVANKEEAGGQTVAARGLLAMTSSPAYQRAGELSVRVDDCTKAEDALETKLQSIKGEILDMVMEGTDGSRTCSLSALIPAHEFRGFIAELRKMGKVQSERITASKLRPGQAEGTPPGDPDPRELSLVSLRMADEKVAQTVLEGRGVLAASFDRSASHFLKGLAVLVEFFGLALPFVLALVALAVPALVVLKLGRRRPSGI